MCFPFRSPCDNVAATSAWEHVGRPHRTTPAASIQVSKARDKALMPATSPGLVASPRTWLLESVTWPRLFLESGSKLDLTYRDSVQISGVAPANARSVGSRCGSWPSPTGSRLASRTCSRVFPADPSPPGRCLDDQTAGPRWTWFRSPGSPASPREGAMRQTQ